MQIFCLTYAGGTTAFYDQLEAELDSYVSVVKLEYSGHGTRRKEALCSSFEELADDLYEQIKDKCKDDKEYALFGYSMGSVSAVELYQKIKKCGEIPLPQYMFLAAHLPYADEELVAYRDSKLDEKIKERTLKFGGIPEKLIHNNAFWRMYLPIYRTDYSMLADYAYDKLEVMEVPVTFFYSETDTPLKELMLWQQYFEKECEYICFEGTHFFMNDFYGEIAEVVVKRLNINQGEFI